MHGVRDATRMKNPSYHMTEFTTASPKFFLSHNGVARILFLAIRNTHTRLNNIPHRTTRNWARKIATDRTTPNDVKKKKYTAVLLSLNITRIERENQKVPSSDRRNDEHVEFRP